jgi:sulfite exporter TauE/SafE
VLPALALPGKYEGALYLFSFGFGTIAAMIILSQALGIVALGLAEKSLRLYRQLSISLSSIAISLGVFWLIF